MLLLFFVSSKIALAQPYPNTGDHSVCVNSTEPYGVVLTPGSTYAWSVTPLTTGNGTITAGATPNLITVNWTSVGTATLQVIETNSQGCPGDPVTITVSVNPIPVLAITNLSVCGAGTADLTAAAVTAGSTTGLAYTYWTDAAGTIPLTTPTAIGAGSYYIKGTSAAGCFDIKQVTVTSTATPTLITTGPAVCGAGTADLTAASVTAGSTGGLIFTYWSDASATISYTTPTAAGAGTYYIKGTLAGGCFDIKPVTVTSTANPLVVISDPSVCSPATADLTDASVTTGSTAGLTFTYWSDAAGTISLTTPAAVGAGTYYIRGTLAGGCSDIKPVTVTASATPTITITNPAPVCGSGTADLTAAAVTAGSTAGLTYTYWLDAAATIPVATPAAVGNGTYYIKGVIAGGCFDVKSVTVTTNPSPAPLITGPTPVCVSINGSVSAYSTPDIPGHSYTWSVAGGSIAAGQNTNQINVTWTTPGAGTVSVTETITASGCFANIVKNITVTPKPVTSPITHN
jgi:large repetitive protein